MKRLVVVFAAALFMLFAVGYAYAYDMDDVKRAVTACEKAVIQKSPYSQNSQYPKFSAYVKSDGQVKYFGAASDLFEFEKCMSDFGIDIDTVETPEPQNKQTDQERSGKKKQK